MSANKYFTESEWCEFRNNYCRLVEAMRGNIRYDEIKALPKFGNDIDEVDMYGREAAYTYTRPVEKYENPHQKMKQCGDKYHRIWYHKVEM